MDTEEEELSLPTLEEFLSDWATKKWPKNSYVTSPGFRTLYVRVSSRRIPDLGLVSMVDLANAEAEVPGAGAFTRLIAQLRRDYPQLGIFAESVLNPRLERKLLGMGFTQYRNENSYYLL